MRSLLTATLIGALALALVAPTAAAQASPASPAMTLRLDSADGPTPIGNSTILKGEVAYTSDAASAATHTTGIRVKLSVVKAPFWATVVLTPQEIVLHPTSPAASWHAHAQEAFRAQVYVNEGGEALRWEEIVVEAHADGTSFVASAHAQATAVVAPAAAAPCHHPEGGDATAASTDDGLTAQTAAAAPAAQAGVWLAGGLGAAAASGVAIALRRRLRR